MKNCPICSRQPKLRKIYDTSNECTLVGARYECGLWWLFGFTMHKATTFKWNEKGWGDLAVERAREEWEKE